MKSLVAIFAAATLVSPAFANGNDGSQGMPHLDHVFVIMMENHGYQQIIGNPNEPYLNSLIANRKVNLATNYFAVGHPSLTNYLEIVGGSNFGIRSDNSPAWGSGCSPNIVSGTVNADGSNPPQGVTLDPSSVICPISGSGKDADTPAVDTWNEIPPAFIADIDGVKAVHPGPTVGKSIADQLTQVGLSWKSYQESLPLGGAYGVDNSNGTVSNLSDFTNLPGPALASYTALYAVKHNPFAYFQSVQQGYSRNNSMNNVVAFGGPSGLFADLATGDLPSFSFIVPNQCDDQHGKGGESAYCAADPGSNGLQAGLNPGLIQQGDVTIERLVEAIHASPVWHEGRNAIVIVWDENDYSGVNSALPPGTLFPSQNQNRVVLTVEPNRDSDDLGVRSNKYYDSFALLKSIEAGFGLPCLNHACDKGVSVMSDLFGGNDKN
jgi:hypothetical protein